MEEPWQESLAALAARESWTAEDHAVLTRVLAQSREAATRLRAMLADLEAANPEPKGAAALKIGVVRYMLCRFHDALAALATATDNKDRRYFQGLCLKQLRQYAKAAEEFQRARERGGDDPRIDCELIEVRAFGGDLDGAQKALGAIEKKIAGTADFHYLRGLIDELRGFGQRAVEAYQAARAADPNHAAATFRLAYYLDLHGEEEQAIELYKQCISRPVVHVNALLNLSVLYEDAGQNDKALACIKKILAANPNHPRAKLFLKDATASKTMYYDEEQARRLAKRNAILDIPVTDFELSVRARNCLKKMNIRTLGDLVRTTESELLAYKNFGETSLKEIRDMLTAKGLRLGQALEDGSDLADLPVRRPVSVANEGVLATPIDHIEFSVRSRRALDSLKVLTLGDLITKTEADLLACRNFGQTSLNEVKQRLAEYGLRLRDSS